MMDKELAVYRLGGTEEQAARWIGISTPIFRQWPDKLHPVMTDRVYAAILRRETAKALGMTHRQFFADFRGETVIESMITRVSIAAIMAGLMPRCPPELEHRDERTGRRKRPGRATRGQRTNAPPEAQAAAG